VESPSGKPLNFPGKPPLVKFWNVTKKWFLALPFFPETRQEEISGHQFLKQWMHFFTAWLLLAFLF
jgi:hypothetical protein